jgi:type II secretory pathway component GspD/PulD (secretin)
VHELVQQALDAADNSHEISVSPTEPTLVINEGMEHLLPLGPNDWQRNGDLGEGDRPDTGSEIGLPTITEEFLETDIREALTQITEDSGFDLAMDEEIRGVVNTKINHLPLNKAIEKILLPHGYVHRIENEQVIICKADPKSPLFHRIAEIDEYHPKHVEPKLLIDSLPTSLIPFVTLVAEKNLLLVEAPTAQRRKIFQRFSAVDQPVPQVVLEAIVCVVSPDSGLQLGLDWQHAVELDGKTALRLGASGLALSGAYSRPGGEGIFGDFATTSAFVKLLCEHGYLTIRASPRVMAKDGEKANISISRETFFSTNTPPNGTTNSNTAFFVTPNIQQVDAGISLAITPRIRGDLVNIHIEKAEVSEDIRSANQLASNPYPIINRRSVSTTVHVKDGRTIVIGGLVQRETVDRENRVPGLGNFPMVGYLFKSRQRQTREADVVIFISPRIVPPSPMD